MLQIIFEFIDGPYDGKVLQGQEGQSNEAARYYLLTNHGRVGQRFKVVSDFAVEQISKDRSPERPRTFQHHHYVVTDRLEEANELIVRATYARETEPKPQPKPHEDAGEPRIELPDARTRHLDHMLNFVRRASQNMAASYSSCWPANAGAGRDPNLMIHLAHVLLNRDFTVFADAAAPREDLPSVPLVALSPNQDWFVAADFRWFHENSALTEILASIASLRGFWLGPRLAIEACGDHLRRVAQYCEHGYAIAAGLHWGNEDSELLRFWKTPAEDNVEKQQFVARLDALSAVWPEPLPVYSDDERGHCYLMSVLFPIEREPDSNG